MNKNEFIEDLNISCNSAVKMSNEYLTKLNLSLSVNWDYDFSDFSDGKAIGVYEGGSVFSGEISIGCNIEELYEACMCEIDSNPWSDPFTIIDGAIKTNVFHEMGHGIVELFDDYLNETDDLDDLYDANKELFDWIFKNEEDAAEQFAWDFYDNTPEMSNIGKMVELYVKYFDTDGKLSENKIQITASDIRQMVTEAACLLLEKKAYHGGATDFDRFDLSYVNTGEGAQAYGFGVYVTESKRIGEHYVNVAYWTNLKRRFGELAEHFDNELRNINLDIYSKLNPWWVVYDFFKDKKNEKSVKENIEYSIKKLKQGMSQFGNGATNGNSTDLLNRVQYLVNDTLAQIMQKFEQNLNLDYYNNHVSIENIVNGSEKLTNMFLSEYEKVLSLIRLMNIFRSEMESNEKNERMELNKFETGEGRYDIVKIDSFDDASAYSKYVSWCITQDRYMFDRYTNGGVNQFYFCLRDDFMDCNPIVGENCPLDDYGLSMIAVSVNSEGKLATCTCRWNHDNGGDDGVMDAGEISKVIGKNFYNVFKPNNNWDYAIEDMKKKLAEGVPLEKIFDFIDAGFPRKKWSLVYYKDKANFISADRRILSDEWFDDVSAFFEGYAVVTTKYGSNLIGEDGKYLFKNWYDHLAPLRCGLAAVEMNLKYNYLRVDETVLCKTWFDRADDFVPQTERAKVYIEGNGYNLIDTNGNFILKEWARSIMRINEHNIYKIYKMGEDNINHTAFVDVDGNMIVNYWFVRTTEFINGKCIGVYVDDATGDEHSLLFNSKGEILGREKLDK